MRLAALLGAWVCLLGHVGCDSAGCADAEARIEECGVNNVALTSAGESCQETAACEAECVLAAPCDEIEATFTEAAENDLTACVEACAVDAGV